MSEFPPNLTFRDLSLNERSRTTPTGGGRKEKLLSAVLEAVESDSEVERLLSLVLEAIEKDGQETRKLLSAILSKELKVVTQEVNIPKFPEFPKVQKVIVQNPTDAVEVLNPTDLSGIGEIVKQNRTIISLLQKLANQEVKVEVLGGEKPAQPSVATRIFRQIKNRTSFTETFTYDGSGSITLKRIPITGTAKVYAGGGRFTSGAAEDYTISGRTITPVNSWPTGIKIVVDYEA